MSNSKYNTNSPKQITLEVFLLNKMEEKINDIHQIRQLFINLNSYEEIQFNRNKIIQAFFALEDDLRESYQLIKSTLIQNKDLNEQLEYEEGKSQELETKVIILEKNLIEANKHMNMLTRQVHILGDKTKGDEDYIKDLEKRLVSTELASKKKVEDHKDHKEVSQNPVHNSNSKSKNRGNLMKIEEPYDLPVSDNISKVPNLIMPSLNYKYDQSNSTIRSINNYSEILSDRENSKKLINDYVNEYLNEDKSKFNVDATVKPTIDIEKSNSSSNNNSNNAKIKAKRVTDIIMKLNSNPDINSIVSKIFGEALLNQLMSAQVDDILLQKVEETILEIDKLREKDRNEQNLNNLKNDHDSQPYLEQAEDNRNKVVDYSSYLNKSYAERERDVYDILSANNLLKSKSSYTNSKTKFHNTNFYQNNISNCAINQKNNSSEELNFENSLRRYISGNAQNRNDSKVFRNYTKPYGDFFDPKLQKGGETKVTDNNKYRSKSKNKNNNSNYNYSYISSPSKSFSSNNNGNLNNMNIRDPNFNLQNYQFKFSD